MEKEKGKDEGKIEGEMRAVVDAKEALSGQTWWNGDGGWSEGVKWKKRALVVDENLSFVECRNLERA